MCEQCIVGPLFRPWAEITLDDVSLNPGDHLLDIACRTGIVARVAKQRLNDAGLFAGVDVSREKLAVARRVAPGIDWRERNASDLLLRDNERSVPQGCPLRDEQTTPSSRILEY